MHRAGRSIPMGTERRIMLKTQTGMALPAVARRIGKTQPTLDYACGFCVREMEGTSLKSTRRRLMRIRTLADMKLWSVVCLLCGMVCSVPWRGLAAETVGHTSASEMDDNQDSTEGEEPPDCDPPDAGDGVGGEAPSCP